MYGSTNAHEVLWRASGAISDATITSAAVAIQMGRKRAATIPLATTPAAFRVGLRALTDRPIRGGEVVKS
jgi:hypothetical protein